MANKTHGQIAYEAFYTSFGNHRNCEPGVWESITLEVRQAWEASANAARNEAPLKQPSGGVDVSYANGCHLAHQQ